MKNIKTFESFSKNDNEITNESVGSILKEILMFPISVIGIITMQFVGGRIISKVIKESLLDIYANIDTLISTLENILTLSDITDSEKSKVNAKLKGFKKIKEKYPTLESYKAELSKKAPMYNFRNREYLRNQIWDYEPRIMTALEIIKKLEKVYKLVHTRDVIGEVRPNHFNFFN